MDNTNRHISAGITGFVVAVIVIVLGFTYMYNSSIHPLSNDAQAKSLALANNPDIKIKSVVPGAHDEEFLVIACYGDLMKVFTVARHSFELVPEVKGASDAKELSCVGSEESAQKIAEVRSAIKDYAYDDSDRVQKIRKIVERQ